MTVTIYCSKVNGIEVDNVCSFTVTALVRTEEGQPKTLTIKHFKTVSEVENLKFHLLVIKNKKSWTSEGKVSKK